MLRIRICDLCDGEYTGKPGRCLDCREDARRGHKPAHPCCDCGALVSAHSTRCAECNRKHRLRPNRVRAPVKAHGIKLCYWCGHDFEYHPKIRTQFCSRTCRSICHHHNGKSCLVTDGPVKIQARPCLECGREFTPATNASHICSTTCRNARASRAVLVRWRSLHPSVERCCVECGNVFTAGWDGTRTSNAHFCSQGCAKRYRHRDRRHRKRDARPQGKNEWISIRIVGERDGWRCHLCGKRVPRTTKRLEAMPSIDHITPLSKGGTHELQNVALAHHRCNSLRRDGKTPAQMRLIA